jgi:hypothetical protein
MTKQNLWKDPDIDFIICSAVRYAVGRPSMAPGIIADFLTRNWNSLSPRAKRGIQEDLETEFSRDDEDRINGEKYPRLGWSCDRNTWDRVRALWIIPPE